MDIIAHERAMDFAQRVIELSENDQNALFEYLIATGTLTEEEAKGLRVYVGLYHMFSDRDYYTAMKTAVCEQLCNEIFGGRKQDA